MDYKLFVCVQCGFEYDEAEGLARGRHHPGHSLGRHPRGLELPGLRRGQVGLRDGRDCPPVTGLGRARRAMGKALVSPVCRSPIRGTPTGRHNASRSPRRRGSCCVHSILDGMRDMLVTRDWSSITLSDVARAAGISRQTIYNEFGSRQGLPRDTRCDWPTGSSTPSPRPSTATSATSTQVFLEGFRAFFVESASDPLVISLLTGGAKPDLLQIITTDSAPIISRCSQRLTSVPCSASWVQRQRRGRRCAGQGHRAAGDELRPRCCPKPTTTRHRDLARLMTPFAERYGVVDTLSERPLSERLSACPASPQAEGICMVVSLVPMSMRWQAITNE